MGENEELCINWTVQNIMCETNYIVVANASNNLGFALSNVTFCPLDVGMYLSLLRLVSKHAYHTVMPVA